MTAETSQIDYSEVGVTISEGFTACTKKKNLSKSSSRKKVSPKATCRKAGKKSSGKKKKKKKIEDVEIRLPFSPKVLSKRIEQYTSNSAKSVKRLRKDFDAAEDVHIETGNEEREQKETLETDEIQPKRNALNVQVHRMRHLNFRPRAILHMAATPFNADCGDYIAISREDGSVEIKSPDEKWRSLATIPGMSSKTVDVMTWVCGRCENKPRETTSLNYYSDFHKSHTENHKQRTLIGASKDGTIFTIDFSKGKLSAVTGSGGGGIFALSSLCGSECCKNTCNNLVAAGCEDGAIRIYKLRQLNTEQKLDLVSTIPHAGSSVLSLAWCKSSRPKNQGMDGSVMYAGIADGTIRRYECKATISRKLSKVQDEYFDGNQTWTSTVRMTVECFGRTTPTLVWALVALTDGTIISADSLGHIQFWDGKTGTMLQSFEHNDKKADVLSLAVTPDESKVFASGIDSRVICIEKPKLHNIRHGPEQWVITQAQRSHTHDVKAMCVYRAHDLIGSFTFSEKPEVMLCSGGVDTKICTYFVDDFKKQRPKIWFPWPTNSPISMAKSARILLLQRETSLELHMLAPKQTNIQQSIIYDEDKTFIGSLDIQSRHNIVCSDISMDGKYIVASTGSTLLLFKVYFAVSSDGGTMDCSPVKILLDGEVKGPCFSVRFVSNNSFICVGMDDNIRLLKIQELGQSNEDDQTTNTETLEANITVSQNSLLNIQTETVNKMFPVHAIAVAEDGKQFATVRGGVGKGTVSIYRIEQDCMKHYWVLPALEAPVTSIAFLTGIRQEVVATCSNFATYVFSLRNRGLSQWSDNIGFPITPKLPVDLKKLPDFPFSILPHPKDRNKFILASFGAFSVVNTALSLPERCKIFPQRLRGKKRKLDEKGGKDNSSNPNCAICMRYSSMLYTDFISEQEMVVVEQPWLDVFAALPGALERKLFGT